MGLVLTQRFLYKEVGGSDLPNTLSCATQKADMSPANFFGENIFVVARGSGEGRSSITLMLDCWHNIGYKPSMNNVGHFSGLTVFNFYRYVKTMEESLYSTSVSHNFQGKNSRRERSCIDVHREM